MKRIIAVLLLLTVAMSLCACKQKEDTQALREEDIRMICELATLECYYNHVAKFSKEADNIFQKDRELWIEYEGKAVIGIKMTDVAIEVNQDSVSITLPPVEILSTDYSFSEDSYVASGDGWLVKNKITAEDQEQAVIDAQEEMKQSILENKELLLKAELRAKELIENYIKKIGEVAGTEYTIQWN